MTKKHFIALADAIREHNRIESAPEKHGHCSFNQVHLNMLADFCQSSNPNFNRE